MRIEIEPRRLERFLKAITITKGKPLIPVVLTRFDGNGAIVKNSQLQIAAVYANFKKKYFLSFETLEEEDVPLSASLIEKLGQGFNDEKITLMSTDNQIRLIGSNETYEESLQFVEEEKFAVEFKEGDLKISPTINCDVEVMVKANDLSALPKADYYTFMVSENSLIAVIEDEESRYTKKIKPIKVDKIEKDSSITVSSDYFLHITSNLSDDVWVFFNEDVIVFTRKATDYSLAYALAGTESE